jgi:hypothetical protein
MALVGSVSIVTSNLGHGETLIEPSGAPSTSNLKSGSIGNLNFISYRYVVKTDAFS